MVTVLARNEQQTSYSKSDFEKDGLLFYLRFCPTPTGCGRVNQGHNSNSCWRHLLCDSPAAAAAASVSYPFRSPCRLRSIGMASERARFLMSKIWQRPSPPPPPPRRRRRLRSVRPSQLPGLFRAECGVCGDREGEGLASGKDGIRESLHIRVGISLKYMC